MLFKEQWSDDILVGGMPEVHFQSAIVGMTVVITNSVLLSYLSFHNFFTVKKNFSRVTFLTRSFLGPRGLVSLATFEGMKYSFRTEGVQ